MSSITGGIVSDKLQRRKPFVIVASLLIAVGLLIVSLFPTWSAVLVAAIILGIGVGTYLAVDLALATQILPTEEDRGKDLGIMNTAIFLPMVIAPGIAALALDVFQSYRALYLILAIATACSALLILPIKKVR